MKRTVPKKGAVYTEGQKPGRYHSIYLSGYFIALGKEKRIMHWMLLFIAGLLEITWAVGLKYTEGFTKLGPSVVTILGTIASFYFLSLALRHLPLGTAYAIWTGIGTIGTVILGIILFKEAIDPLRLLCIGMIVTGIVGLKLVS